MVVLPAESQQRLVQLLYFLPTLPADLLTQLSRCCIMGRLGSSLAGTLIGILYMRYHCEMNYILSALSLSPHFLWDRNTEGFFILYFFENRDFLHRPDCLGTHNVDQTGFELTEILLPLP